LPPPVALKHRQVSRRVRRLVRGGIGWSPNSARVFRIAGIRGTRDRAVRPARGDSEAKSQGSRPWSCGSLQHLLCRGAESKSGGEARGEVGHSVPPHDRKGRPLIRIRRSHVARRRGLSRRSVDTANLIGIRACIRRSHRIACGVRRIATNPACIRASRQRVGGRRSAKCRLALAAATEAADS
jgi:hypothetical protein